MLAENTNAIVENVRKGAAIEWTVTDDGLAGTRTIAAKYLDEDWRTCVLDRAGAILVADPRMITPPSAPVASGAATR